MAMYMLDQPLPSCNDIVADEEANGAPGGGRSSARLPDTVSAWSGHLTSKTDRLGGRQWRGEFWVSSG